MKDQYGRKINYLRISVTDLCNLRCKYCMPHDGIAHKKEYWEVLRNEEILQLVRIMAELGVDKIRITGGEPLIRKGIVDLIRDIKAVPGIRELAMTTNGLLLGRFAEELKEAGLDRVNISIDTLDPEKYKEITRGGELSKVMEGIEKAKALGLGPIKLNTALVGGFNDDEIRRLVELTRDEEVHVRFIELMPIGEASNWTSERFISNDRVLKEVPELQACISNDPSSPARYYRLPDGHGKVGLINPISCSFCNNCNRLRLTSDGKLKPCLHSDQEINLMEAVRSEDWEAVKAMIVNAVDAKPEKHHMEDDDFVPVARNMNRIGG